MIHTFLTLYFFKVTCVTYFRRNVLLSDNKLRDSFVVSTQRERLTQLSFYSCHNGSSKRYSIDSGFLSRRKAVHPSWRDLVPSIVEGSRLSEMTYSTQFYLYIESSAWQSYSTRSKHFEKLSQARGKIMLNFALLFYLPKYSHQLESCIRYITKIMSQSALLIYTVVNWQQREHSKLVQCSSCKYARRITLSTKLLLLEFHNHSIANKKSVGLLLPD